MSSLLPADHLEFGMFAFRVFSISLLGLVLPAARLPDPPQLSLEQFAAPIRKQIQEAYSALRSRPRDALASGALGILLYACEQNQAAAVCFERAHTFDPKEFRWTSYLATVQAALGDLVQAVSTFRESLQQQTGKPHKRK